MNGPDILLLLMFPYLENMERLTTNIFENYQCFITAKNLSTFARTVILAEYPLALYKTHSF